MRCSLGCVVLASIALAACGSSTTKTVTTAASTTSATTATTSTTPAQPVYFRGAVVGADAQRPRNLELTADGTLEVQGVQWASWGGPEATGTGNASYHGCIPNCAAAPAHTALVSVRLFGVRTCGGRRYYSGVTLTLNSGQKLDKSYLQRSWSPC